MSASQYDPNKLGWGAAIVTCVFTAALGFGAYTIHKNTYRHPRDPMNQQVYYERDTGEHAAGGEHAGEADHSETAGGEHKEAAPAEKH